MQPLVGLIMGSVSNWETLQHAAGEEKIREVAQNLRATGVTLAFSVLKKQVREVFEAGGLIALLGRENLFDTKEQALHVLLARAG